jgi:hypothetical protein
MEREHLIIIAIVLVVMWMLMKHSHDCNCNECMHKAMMPSHIRYDEPNGMMPGHIRMRDEEVKPPFGHIRMSDKYFGATQHVQHHLRYDNKRGLLNGLYAGAPQRIRYGCEGQDCVGQV